MANKNLHVETLRGLACLLVVGIHSISTLYQNNLMGDNIYILKIASFLSYLRMPLFAFLSGYVYSMRPVKFSSLRRFIKGKIRRIIIPLFTVGTSVSLITHFFGTKGVIGISDALLCVIMPVGVYWFLGAIFIIFIISAVLDSLNIMNSKKNIALVIIASLLIRSIDVNITNILSLSGALYLFPFFIFGVLMQRFDIDSVSLKVASTVILLLAAIHISQYTGTPDDIRNERFFGSIVSICFCYFIFKLKLTSRSLVYIGGFSYSIYLFHILFVTAPRIIISKANLFDTYPVYPSIVLSIFIGISAPIIFDKIISKRKTLSLLFLGKKRSWFFLIKISSSANS